eukprot:5471585-Pyramimonas_sp.AAC.1
MEATRGARAFSRGESTVERAAAVPAVPDVLSEGKGQHTCRRLHSRGFSLHLYRLLYGALMYSIAPAQLAYLF